MSTHLKATDTTTLSNTLSKLTGDPVGLGLSYTCTLVAKEMRRMSLNHNVVTFSMLYSDGLRQPAGQFHTVIEFVRRAKIDIMLQMSRHLRMAKRQDLARGFPDVEPILLQHTSIST
jgi:hypothetical protein